MEYKCDNDKYRIFICYRRKSTDPSFGASEDVAGMLHWWLNHGPDADSGLPALFEECYPSTGTLTFGKEGIDEVMPQMQLCFVVLCQGFFDRILKTYHKVLRNYRTLSEQEQLEKTRQLLSSSERDVCYLEIRRALECRQVRLCPVLVESYGNGFFSNLDNDEVEDLQKILGPGSEILFNKINAQTVDYAVIAPHMQGRFWAKLEQQTAQDLMQQWEKDASVAALRQYLRDVCAAKRSNGSTVSFDQNRIKKDLKLCAKTMFGQQMPRMNREHFRAGNPKLVYDPVRMHHDREAKPPFLASSLLEHFAKDRAAFGLKTDRFRYWNVDLDPNAANQEQTIGLSVCAVCFGTLSTYHRLHKDSLLLEEGQLTERMRQPFVETIQSGINLLLALRNPYTKTWPSSWVFNEIIGVEGTANQTTLSLSTLMSCGFLSPDTPSITAEQLKARYSYIWQSVQVLLGWGQSVCTYTGAACKGWRYTERSTNAPALLPTVFVFDTLCKLHQCVKKLEDFFGEREDAFCCQLHADADRLSEELTQIIEFFRSEQRTVEDGAAGAFKRYADTEFSVTHTAYVVKSLQQYVRQQAQPDPVVLQILAPAVDYLLNAVEQMQVQGGFFFKDWERFENFCDSDPEEMGSNPLKGTYGERYEHCAELIVAEALIKIAENTNDGPLCDRVMQLLQWLFDTYAATSVKQRHDNIFIKSARPKELMYPIYYLYYYRMFLWDYLSLLKKKEASGNG